MPGPAPSRNPRRRNARPDWRRLPASGRKGEPPAWPLPGRSTKAERALWADLWTTPQAVAWEELGWARMVARYVRITVAAEARFATGVVMSEARQLEDRLGLNPLAMKKLMWEVDGSVGLAEGESDVIDLDDFRTRLG